MKHSYLYPLEDDDRWIWRAGRMDTTDLFGAPKLDAANEEWAVVAGIGEVLGQARNELHMRVRDRPRICIGRHYMIPGSLCEVAREREAEADSTVRKITARFWDAPHLARLVYADTYQNLQATAGEYGRDDWETIKNFLVSYRGQRLIPLWM